MKITGSQSALLDWVRALSAQAVVVGHALSTVGWLSERYLIQNLGVIAFFVLSGLLVTYSVMNKGPEYGFSDYLADRAARIFVPFVPAVVFIVACGFAFNLGGPLNPGTIVGNLLMLNDFPPAKLIPALPQIDRVGTGRPLWSVAMEWWFYMAASAAYFYGRLPRWSLALVCAGVAVFATVLLIGVLGYAWFAGALIAVFLARLPRWSWGRISLLLGILTTARLIPARDSEFYDLSLILLLAALLCTILKAMEAVRVHRVVAKAGAFLAAISYSLYLTHYTVLALTAPLDGATRVAVAVLAGNAVAIGMWWMFERHYRDVARWLRASHATASHQVSDDDNPGTAGAASSGVVAVAAAAAAPVRRS